jgi:hypothetical protein
LKYDSILERKFHEQFPDLIYHENNLKTFPYTFYDEDGVAFQASPDFYCEQRNIVIELKGSQLNTHKTKLVCAEKIQYQLNRFGNKEEDFYLLKHGFNQSLFKQGIVNRGIRSSNYQYQFLLIFTDDTKLSTQSKNKMAVEKIDWCYVSEWQDYQFDKVGY